MDQEPNDSADETGSRRGGPWRRCLGPSVGLVETQSVEFESLPLDSGETLAPVTIAYETYGRLNEERDNAILILHAALRRRARRRLPGGRDQARVVGDDDRAGQGLRHRPLLRHLLERHRRLQGQHRAQLHQPGHGQGVRAATSRWSPWATWCGRRSCSSTIWASSAFCPSPAARWAACRPCSGRSPTRRRSPPASPSPPPPSTRPCRSPSTRWAGRPSWATPTGTAATTTAAIRRTAGWRWPA